MANPEKKPLGEEPRVEEGSGFIRWFRSLGPAVITAALVLGPGSLTVSTKLGALFGYQVLWIVVLATLFMMVFTEMGARIGMASDQSLLTLVRRKWGSKAAVLIGAGSFLITSSFQAGNAIGTGIAFGTLTGTSASLWTVLFTLLAIGSLFLKNFYRVLEKVMLCLVGLMLASFLFTLLMVRPDPAAVAGALIPRVPEGSFVLITAFVATTFSIVGAFYQSYFVQERGWGRGQVKEGVRESYSGILCLGLISAMVMVCAAAVLLPQGIQVNSVVEMGKTLEPLYGGTATAVFTLGLWGAALSSLMGNAAIGGALLADALGWGARFHEKRVKGLVMSVMLIGALVALTFGSAPLELIVTAQMITVVIVPLIGTAMFRISNDRAVMGDLTNSAVKNLIGGIGLLVLYFLSVYTLGSLIRDAFG
ncbi:MAG: Nramp family divalent metal transporter [Planifilum fimeticola]|jgi:Mn2+/Fe2+ NRAMP family transporter